MDNDFCDKGTLHLLVKGEDGKWAVRVQKLFQDSRSPLWCFGYPYMRKVWDWVILKVMQELFWCQKSNTYYGNILQDAAACNTCIVDYLKKKKKKNAKNQDSLFAGKKNHCLLRNYHISQHFQNHQSVLGTTRIEAKTSKFICTFSVTSYWYFFYINIFNPMDNDSHLSRQTLLMAPRSTQYFPQTPIWSLDYFYPYLMFHHLLAKSKINFFHLITSKRKYIKKRNNCVKCETSQMYGK